MKTQQIAEEKRGVAETEKIARQTEEIKMVAMAGNIISPVPGTFMNAVWARPAMQDWTEKARAEPWSVERYDR